MISPEVRPGLCIISASFLALLLCNIGYSSIYFSLWEQNVQFQIGRFVIEKQLLHLINDGLMAIFFLLITIEIRYEFAYGFLNNRQYMMLPLAAAVGGIVMPASIYAVFNYGSSTMAGWAIPVATDVAFSLACLMLLAPYFSSRVRIFLLSVAIFDDLAAILIIAFFYTEKVSVIMLSLSLLMTVLMWLLRREAYDDYRVYAVLGVCLWATLLKSGVHATLSGSVVALLLPMAHDQGRKAKSLYETLLPWTQYLILPLFAFANSGVVLAQVGGAPQLFLGIVFGLVVGKPTGIIASCYLSNWLNFSTMPKGMNYHHIIGVSFLCGIGYTMSLFIGSLAFDAMPGSLLNTVKVSVLLGSLVSSLLGMSYLFLFCRDS